jgi:hypothetical protein
MLDFILIELNSEKLLGSLKQVNSASRARKIHKEKTALLFSHRRQSISKTKLAMGISVCREHLAYKF